MTEIRQGSSPNFCPPTEEGIVLVFQDESGELVELEFLGLILHGEAQYGIFFAIDEENPALSSGEVIILEATEMDEDGQPSGFELVEDEAVISDIYKEFQEATKDLYRFQ